MSVIRKLGNPFIVKVNTRTLLIIRCCIWLSSKCNSLTVNLDGCSAVIVDKADFAQVEKIEVTFDYVAPQ